MGPAAAGTCRRASLARPCCAGIYGDPERFVQQYWSRYPDTYFTSDGAKLDEDGYFWLLGGLTTSSTSPPTGSAPWRWKAALVDNLSRWPRPRASAAAHEVKGQAIVAFVTLKDQVARPPTT